METIFSKLPIVLGATVAVGLYFSSCKKEQNVQKEGLGNTTVKPYAEKCGFKVCVLTAIEGHRLGSFDCIGNGICYVQKIQCFSDFVLCPDWKIPDCAVVDCKNPWNFKGIFVNPIPRYRDVVKGNPSPQPYLDFVPIRVTSDIAVLQFYTEVKGTLDRQTLTLPASFSLPKDVSLNLGLSGYTVPSGNYPVVFDERSKTLNAIVYVK